MLLSEADGNMAAVELIKITDAAYSEHRTSALDA